MSLDKHDVADKVLRLHSLFEALRVLVLDGDKIDQGHLLDLTMLGKETAGNLAQECRDGIVGNHEPATTPLSSLFKEATKVTDAALDVFDHIKAPVFSSSVIAKDLLADESIPEHARVKILAILDNMELAKFLLEHFTFKLDVACEGWKDALKKASGGSNA